MWISRCSLVCSWKIEVWTGTGLFWGLQAKAISTDKFWENWIYMNTLGTLVRDFQGKALHVQYHPRDCKRVFGGQGVSKDVFWELWETKVCQTTSCDESFCVSCFGHMSLSESSRRRSKLLPAVQISIFQEQTKSLSVVSIIAISKGKSQSTASEWFQKVKGNLIRELTFENF